MQKAFLMHYSEYFKNALIGSWKEAKEGIIHLADVDCSPFNVFVDWIYTQKLPVGPAKWRTTSEDQNSDDQGIALVKLYVFANRFLVPTLRKALTHKILHTLDEVNRGAVRPLSYASVIYAFNNLPSTDPMLDMFVDLYHMSWTSESDIDPKQIGLFPQLPHEFLLRFMRRVGTAREKQGSSPWLKFSLNVCSYHEHESALEKSNCPFKSRNLQRKILLERETSVSNGQEDTSSQGG